MYVFNQDSLGLLLSVGLVIIKDKNTPGTAGGPGGRDRTLAVKNRKNIRKITFFLFKKKFTPKPPGPKLSKMESFRALKLSNSEDSGDCIYILYVMSSIKHCLPQNFMKSHLLYTFHKM